MKNSKKKMVITRKEMLTGLQVPLVEQKGGRHQDRTKYDRKRHKREMRRETN